MKVCAEPGCPALIHVGSRCSVHEREKDRARGSRQERGYDADHFKLRAHYARLQAAGHTLLCWRCRGLITAGEPWDLGHDDSDRTRYRGPEHRSCNRATSGRR